MAKKKVVSEENLFEAPVIPPLPEFHDEIVTKVTTIDALPGGFMQTAQALPEPIHSVHYETVAVSEDEVRPGSFTKEVVPSKLVSAEEGLEMIRTGAFQKAMVPKKSQCSDCGVDLTPDRGLHCVNCRPHLGKDPGEFLYCGVSGE